MRRTVVFSLVVIAVALSAGPAPAQQTRPATPPAVAAADEIKLDESGVLKAAAIQSRMSAILANFALLQRQAQDLQQEMTKALEERKKLLEDSSKRVRVEVRDPNEWVYDEAGQRYVRSRRNP
jgi:H+/gluconate symporter-like permease